MPDFPLTARFRERGVPLTRLSAHDGTAIPVSFGDAAGEQRATRNAVGLFDFSFMAGLDVSGPDATAFLERLQTRSLAMLPTGRLSYTLLLREDGTVLVDATVWHLGKHRYRLVIGRWADVGHVRSVAANYDVQIDEWSERNAVIAVQGPRSAALLAACGASTLPGYFCFADERILGRPCTIVRIGYTGELGYELLVDAVLAPGLWDGLRNVGHALGARECGFEAANALRIEAGFVLFSSELVAPTMPNEIGLGRLVRFGRCFLGADALNAVRWRSPARVLVGLAPIVRPVASAPGRNPRAWPRPGIAELTSSAYSALFQRLIGMGYVHPEDRNPGTRVALRSGATARVARLPFYDPVKRLPRGPS